MTTTDIRNHAALAPVIAGLDKLFTEVAAIIGTQNTLPLVEALYENLSLHTELVMQGIDYHKGILQAGFDYIDAGGNPDDMFVILSHGIDTDLHPHTGCLIQLSYYSDSCEGGIKDDEYLYTGLIPRITKAKYKEITRTLRLERLKWELIGDTTGDDDVWYSSNPLSKRLENWKLLKSDARRVYAEKNHD